MLKLIVFDWDDCIVQGSSEAYYATYAAAIKEHGIEVDLDTVEKQVRALWGRPHRLVIESIIGIGHTKLTDVVHSYERLVSSDFFFQHLSLITGAKEALLMLKDDYKLAIATGMNAVSLKERLIPHFDMEGIFSSIISSSELLDPGRGKPYPDMLLKLLKDFNVSSSEALMVGDASTDVLMAQAAEVRPIVVLTGQLTKEEAEQLGVRDVISSVASLPLLVKGIRLNLKVIGSNT